MAVVEMQIYQIVYGLAICIQDHSGLITTWPKTDIIHEISKKGGNFL